MASGSRRPAAGNRPSTSPTMNTTGNSRPLALWTVRTDTASGRVRARRRPDRRPPRSASAGGSPRTSRDRRPGARTANGRCRRTGRRSASASSAPATGSRASLASRPESAEERVEDLAGRAGRGRARRSGARSATRRSTAVRVDGARRRSPGCRSTSSTTSQSDRFRRRAASAIAVRSSPPRRVQLGRRERVQIDARARVGDVRRNARAAGPPAAHTGPTCPRTASGARPH